MWKPEREKDEDRGRNGQGEGQGQGGVQQSVSIVGVEGTVALKLCPGHWRHRGGHPASHPEGSRGGSGDGTRARGLPCGTGGTSSAWAGEEAPGGGGGDAGRRYTAHHAAGRGMDIVGSDE